MAKAKSRRRNYLPMGISLTDGVPEMRGKAQLLGVVAAIPQMYLCEKCGYMGSVGLEPGKIKLDKNMRI